MEAGEKITAVQVSPNGSYVVVGTDKGKIVVMDRNSGAFLRQYKPHTKQVTCISIRDGYSIVTGSSDGNIFVQFLTPNKTPKKIEIK